MGHEALNEWLVEAQGVLDDQAKWDCEFRHKNKNLGIGLGYKSGADSSKGETNEKDDSGNSPMAC